MNDWPGKQFLYTGSTGKAKDSHQHPLGLHWQSKLAGYMFDLYWSIYYVQFEQIS